MLKQSEQTPKESQKTSVPRPVPMIQTKQDMKLNFFFLNKPEVQNLYRTL